MIVPWIAVLAAAGTLPVMRYADEDIMRTLANQRGCMNCHREAPATEGWDKLIPLTPSWSEIAARYRGDAGAEEALAARVLHGTSARHGERHWEGHASMPNMPANSYQVTPLEARGIVRWILSLP